MHYNGRARARARARDTRNVLKIIFTHGRTLARSRASAQRVALRDENSREMQTREPEEQVAPRVRFALALKYMRRRAASLTLDYVFPSRITRVTRGRKVK